MSFFQGNLAPGGSAFTDVGMDQANILYRHRWSARSTLNMEMGRGMVIPRSCADGWTILVHPDGWRYFHSPGIVTDDRELVQQTPNTGIFERELDGDDYEEYFNVSSAGNK